MYIHLYHNGHDGTIHEVQKNVKPSICNTLDEHFAVIHSGDVAVRRVDFDAGEVLHAALNDRGYRRLCRS